MVSSDEKLGVREKQEAPRSAMRKLSMVKVYKVCLNQISYQKKIQPIVRKA